MRILIIFFCIVFAFNSYGQETTTLNYDYVCSLSRSYIKPSSEAKKERLSSQLGGVINIDMSECKNMPDSLIVAITNAKEVWESYLPFGTDINIKIQYINLNGSDINTDVEYSATDANLFYPSSLYRELETQSDENAYASKSYDALIKINSQTPWVVGFSRPQGLVKNLSYSLLKQFAIALGFGSSIKYNKSRNNFYFKLKRGQTIFDSFLFAEDGTYLKNITNTEREKLAKFVKQANGYVYFEKKDENRKIYAPITFDEMNSLKTLVADGSVMSYKDRDINDLVIDSVTLNILRTIGWSFNINHAIKIVGENIDESGITSAYCDHKFDVVTTGGKVTDPLWECYLPLKNGDNDTIKSTNLTFLLSAINDGDKYQHTLEGDIVAKILFQGKINGKLVACSYNLTLELKPSVLNAEVVYAKRNEEYPDYYDIDVDVWYEGCHYLDAYVEEEYSPMQSTYFSDTPYYTRLHLKDVDSYGQASLKITVRNEHGANYYLINNLFDYVHEQDANRKKVNSVGANEMSGKSAKLKIGNADFMVTKTVNSGNVVIRKILVK